MSEKRYTFVIPDGHEPVLDAEGRATGETRPAPTVEPSRIVRKLTGIADASRRADGSDIPLGEQCREAAATISALVAERDDAREAFRRLDDKAQKQGVKDAIALATANARIAGMEKALAEMVYETTRLSPVDWRGGHDCRISAETLARARAALTGGEDA
jgi:hypothetical protein